MKLLRGMGLLLALAVAVPAVAWAADSAKADAEDLVFKGDAKCTACHDAEDAPELLRISKTHHGGVGRAQGQLTCVSCHGESEKHLKKPDGQERPKPDRVFGRKGARIAAEERSKPCLECHGGDRHLAFWESGRHKKNDISCDNCHTMHEPARSQLRKDNPSITPYTTTSRQL